MAKYLLLDKDGAALLIAEAANATDADLYGHRHVRGYWRFEAMDTATSEARLQEAFERLGMSANAAGAAVVGRGDPRGLRVVAVPHQEARIESAGLREVALQECAPLLRPRP
jgi:hypothetical protein